MAIGNGVLRQMLYRLIFWAAVLLCLAQLTIMLWRSDRPVAMKAPTGAGTAFQSNSIDRRATQTTTPPYDVLLTVEPSVDKLSAQ